MSYNPGNCGYGCNLIKFNSLSSMIMRRHFDDLIIIGYDSPSAVFSLGAYPPDPRSLAAGPFVEPVVAHLYHWVPNSRRREHNFCKKDCSIYLFLITPHKFKY